MTLAPARVRTGPPAPSGPMTARQHVGFVLVLGALIALGPFTIDLYLPALPGLTTDLSTTAAVVQLTLTGTLVGLGGGQLVVGPLSDALGRRRPLVVGTLVHVVASLLCVVAPNVAVLGLLRVLQGAGAAAASVIALAVVRDLFDGSDSARVISRLTLVMGASPVLAPTVGSALLRVVPWRGVFAVLALLGLAMLVMSLLFLPETLPPARRRPAALVPTLRAYGSQLRDRPFAGLVLVAGLSLAAIFAYVSGSSFVLQEEYGLGQTAFGVVFGIGGIALVAATQYNVRLLRTAGPQQLIVRGLVGSSACALLLLVAALTGFGGLAGILVPLWGVLGFAGLALPNAPALALSRHGDAAGTAAALLGAVQFGVGALVSPLVGVLGGDAVAMGLLMAASLVIALGVLLAVVRPWELDLDPEVAELAVAH